MYTYKLTPCVLLAVALFELGFCDIHRIVLRPEKSHKKHTTRHQSTKSTRLRPSHHHHEHHHHHDQESSFSNEQKANEWKPIQHFETSYKPKHESQIYRPKKKTSSSSSSKSLVDLIEFTTSKPQHIPMVQSNINDDYFAIPSSLITETPIKSVVKKPSAYDSFEDPDELDNYEITDYKTPKHMLYKEQDYDTYLSVTNAYKQNNIRDHFQENQELNPMNEYIKNILQNQETKQHPAQDYGHAYSINHGRPIKQNLYQDSYQETSSINKPIIKNHKDKNQISYQEVIMNKPVPNYTINKPIIKNHLTNYHDQQDVRNYGRYQENLQQAANNPIINSYSRYRETPSVNNPIIKHYSSRPQEVTVIKSKLKPGKDYTYTQTRFADSQKIRPKRINHRHKNKPHVNNNNDDSVNAASTTTTDEEIPTYEVHEDVHDFYFPKPLYLNLSPSQNGMNYMNNSISSSTSSTSMESEIMKENYEQTTKKPRSKKNKKQRKIPITIIEKEEQDDY